MGLSKISVRDKICHWFPGYTVGSGKLWCRAGDLCYNNYLGVLLIFLKKYF